MPMYRAYGAVLDSGIEFPELPVADGGTPRWRVVRTSALAAATDERSLGEERIYGEVHARLSAHAQGHRIVVDDTGAFDLSTDLGAVTVAPRADAWPEFVRAHVLGRVLSTAMFLDGALPLHGSAVAFGDGVAAFLAPKGFGKSSLALALTRPACGGRLVSDDTLPVTLPADGMPLAWPGLASVRIREDTLSALEIAARGADTREGKRSLDLPGIAEGVDAALPLRAIYLLEPVLAGPGTPPAAREPLPEQLAAIGTVAHVKIGRMLGPAAAPVMLARAAAVVRRVPVFRLRVARDLDRLGETAAIIAGWHRPA